MDIQTRKIIFVQKFLDIEDENIIDFLEKTMEDELDKNSFHPMSIDEFNLRIDQSVKDAKEGKLTANDQLIQEIKKWH
jgi:hypothetical protein